MRLDPAVIARHARAAGFVGATVAEAVALAYATSGGITTYDYAAGAPGSGRWQGLWGVDTDRWPDYARYDLAAPHVAARVARALYLAHDGWGWSPVWRAGSHVPYLAMAGTEASRWTYEQPQARDNTFATTELRYNYDRQRLADLRAALSLMAQGGQ